MTVKQLDRRGNERKWRRNQGRKRRMGITIKLHFQHLPNARRISFSTGVACTALSRAHICGSSSVIDSIALFIALFIAFRKWSTSFSHFSLKSFSLRKSRQKQTHTHTEKKSLMFWFRLQIRVAQPYGTNPFKIDFMRPANGIVASCHWERERQNEKARRWKSRYFNGIFFSFGRSVVRLFVRWIGRSFVNGFSVDFNYYYCYSREWNINGSQKLNETMELKIFSASGRPSSEFRPCHSPLENNILNGTEQWVVVGRSPFTVYRVCIMFVEIRLRAEIVFCFRNW